MSWLLAILGWGIALSLFFVIIVANSRMARVCAENNILRMSLSDELKRTWLDKNREALEELRAEVFPRATRIEEPDLSSVSPPPEPVQVDEQRYLSENRRTMKRQLREMGFSEDMVRRALEGEDG